MYKLKLEKIHFYSHDPSLEHKFRRSVLLANLFLMLVLVLFWLPLRDTAFTYSLVSVILSNRVLVYFLRFISFLGSEAFFLSFFSVAYWSFNKALGFRGLILMPLAIFLTSEAPKDIIRLPRPGVRGVAVPTYTFPSGHTSGAVSVWGYLAFKAKDRRLWIWALIIIVLVSISRVMLGHHFPGDVIGGIVAGCIFLAVFVGLGSFSAGYDFVKKLPAAVVIPPVTILLATLAFLPAHHAPNFMGYVAGAFAGHLLEKENINYPTEGRWQQHLGRALIGLFVLAAIILELGSYIPPRFQLLVFAQYAAGTFWVTYLAPLLFIRIGLIKGNLT